MQKPLRPTGIAILAILEFIGGILILLLGVLVAALSGSFLASFGYGSLAGIGAAVGVVVALFGILALLVGWGLWTGMGWAWILAVVLTGLGVLGSLVSLALGSFTSIFGLIIDGAILWYLFRPHVKTFFGRGIQVAPQQPTFLSPPPATT